MLAIFLLSHLEHFPDIRNIRIRMEDILEFDGQWICGDGRCYLPKWLAGHYHWGHHMLPSPWSFTTVCLSLLRSQCKWSQQRGCALVTSWFARLTCFCVNVTQCCPLINSLTPHNRHPIASFTWKSPAEGGVVWNELLRPPPLADLGQSKSRVVPYCPVK